MLRATGVDLGTTGTRRVSVGVLFGGPQLDGPAGGPLIANVPSDGLTFRRLNLPPAGREVRARVVREELSYSLPFPLEEAAWDWAESDDVASVLVAPRERLDAVRRQVGDRAALDGEPLSYLRAARASGIEDALIFDFGASRTTLCAMKDSSLEWVRVFFRGGQALTRRIANARKIDEAAAEDLKVRQGMDLPECRDWLGSLVDEALLSRPLPFEHVLICGGGAQMPGLQAELASRLGHPVELFPVPAPLSTYRDVAAYGAALAGKPGRPRVQLRPPVRQASGLRPIYAVWLLGLLAVATVDLEIRHATLAERNQEQMVLLRTAVQQQAPALASTPPEELAAVLSKQVEEARQAELQSPALLLSTLGRLAQPLRTLEGLEIRALTYEEGTLTVEGQAATPQQPETLRSELGSILEGVELVENRAGTAGQTRFKIEGKLRP